MLFPSQKPSQSQNLTKAWYYRFLKILLLIKNNQKIPPHRHFPSENPGQTPPKNRPNPQTGPEQAVTSPDWSGLYPSTPRPGWSGPCPSAERSNKPPLKVVLPLATLFPDHFDPAVDTRTQPDSLALVSLDLVFSFCVADFVAIVLLSSDYVEVGNLLSM